MVDRNSSQYRECCSKLSLKKSSLNPSTRSPIRQRLVVDSIRMCFTCSIISFRVMGWMKDQRSLCSWWRPAPSWLNLFPDTGGVVHTGEYSQIGAKFIGILLLKMWCLEAKNAMSGSAWYAHLGSGNFNGVLSCFSVDWHFFLSNFMAGLSSHTSNCQRQGHFS